MAKKILTLNIGAANIQLAEFEVGAKNALKLTNYGTAPLAAPLDGGNADAILSPAILQIVREKGIKPGKVAVSVPGQMVFPKFAAIPMAGGEEKFEQMIRYEIEQNIPFPIDEMICDRQVIGDTENGDKSVMIVAAKVDQIEEITSAIVATGFTPEIVDVAPIAITNILERNNPGLGECVIMLDIGAKTTSLVIAEGDKLYNRSIPVAGNNVTKEIANVLGCSQEEAEQLKIEKGYVSTGGVTEDDDEVADRIAKACRVTMTRLNAEITRSINFYRGQQHGGTPVRMYLTGGSALLPQIDQFFAESLGIDVEFLDPLASIGVSPKLDANLLEVDSVLLAAVSGLAVHLTGTSRYAINLLPPSLVEARAEQAKIPFLVAGGICLIGGLALWMLALSNEADAIVAQRDAVQMKLDSLKAFDKKVTKANANFEAVNAESEAVRRLIANRTGAVQWLSAVRASLLSGMWISSWDDGSVTIRCWSDRVRRPAGKDLGDALVEKLKGQRAIDPASVKLSSKNSVGKDAQIEQFTVELKFK